MTRVYAKSISRFHTRLNLDAGNLHTSSRRDGAPLIMIPHANALVLLDIPHFSLPSTALLRPVLRIPLVPLIDPSIVLRPHPPPGPSSSV
jgi:hypothetical protein